MIKRLLVVVCSLAFLNLIGCSGDCEICTEYAGEKTCDVVKDVKKKDCKDCTDIEGIAAAKMLGFTVTCSVK